MVRLRTTDFGQLAAGQTKTLLRLGNLSRTTRPYS